MNRLTPHRAAVALEFLFFHEFKIAGGKHFFSGYARLLQFLYPTVMKQSGLWVGYLANDKNVTL